jgi:SAM-dependent methyltransferase
MNNFAGKKFQYSWEEAIEILRRDPTHRELIFHSYLTADLHENARRFHKSAEFAAALALLTEYAPQARTLLDIPGGNGIAAYAFAKAGFDVTTVEPDPSSTVGRGAIGSVLQNAGLAADVVESYGENLPFPSGKFDVVYVRQGLHHAQDLPRMLKEYARVLRAGGVLLACREHVVDDYSASLRNFLDSQVDHQLYGGENAFTLPDYRAAIVGSGLSLAKELGPFDSAINLHPETPASFEMAILASRSGRILSRILPKDWVIGFGKWRMARKKTPGRLYSFLAVKPK